MNSVWNSLYDRAKDRRYGALFLACLLASLGLLILAPIIATIVNESELQIYFLQALPGVGLLGVAWVVLAFRQWRTRRRDHQKFPPLSSDEVRVARSKLIRDRKVRNL